MVRSRLQRPQRVRHLDIVCILVSFVDPHLGKLLAKVVQALGCDLALLDLQFFEVLEARQVCQARIRNRTLAQPNPCVMKLMGIRHMN